MWYETSPEKCGCDQRIHFKKTLQILIETLMYMHQKKKTPHSGITVMRLKIQIRVCYPCSCYCQCGIISRAGCKGGSPQGEFYAVLL